MLNNIMIHDSNVGETLKDILRRYDNSQLKLMLDDMCDVMEENQHDLDTREVRDAVEALEVITRYRVLAGFQGHVEIIVDATSRENAEELVEGIGISDLYNGMVEDVYDFEIQDDEVTPSYVELYDE